MYPRLERVQKMMKREESENLKLGVERELTSPSWPRLSRAGALCKGNLTPFYPGQYNLHHTVWVQSGEGESGHSIAVHLP